MEKNKEKSKCCGAKRIRATYNDKSFEDVCQLCKMPFEPQVDKQQEVREEFINIPFGDFNSPSYNISKEKIADWWLNKLLQAIEQERERIREVLKGICNKSKTERGLARAISNLIKNL